MGFLYFRLSLDMVGWLDFLPRTPLLWSFRRGSTLETAYLCHNACLGSLSRLWPLILFTPTGNTALNSVFTPLSSGREGLHGTNYNEGYFVPLFLGKGIHAQRLLGYSRKYYSLDKMKARIEKNEIFWIFLGGCIQWMPSRWSRKSMWKRRRRSLKMTWKGEDISVSSVKDMHCLYILLNVLKIS